MTNTVSIFERASSFGSKIAITEGKYSITYQQLLKRSQALAAFLLAAKRDLMQEHVAFAAPAGIDYAIIQWGIWQAGGAVVPLNINATLPEMKHCTDTAGVKQLIATASTEDTLRPLCESSNIELIILEDIDENLEADMPELSLERRAMLLFTSGTTNKPKAVVSSHLNIESQVRSLVTFWQWEQSDVIPLFLPMHHVHGIINVLTCALWTGATVDGYQNGFDMQKIFDQINGNTYTVFMAVPTIYVKIIKALEQLSETEKATICSGFKRLRLMISGSAALPIKIHETWSALTEQVLLERYGMTEIGMAISNPMDGERRPGAVGIPLPGVDVQLTDESGGVITEEDLPGEIYIRGENVFQEYWNNPKATAESFDGEWFKTGDMAVLEQGYYRIMGRLSVDIIKSGGYKLSALEIENYLLTHEDIGECAVLGIDDDTWGEVVAVAVVLNGSALLNLSDLQIWSKDNMSNYKTPRKLLVVDSLPKNAMGKVIKKEVKELFV